MGKYHAGFGREGACFLPDLLGVAAHSCLSLRTGRRGYDRLQEGRWGKSGPCDGILMALALF